MTILPKKEQSGFQWWRTSWLLQGATETLDSLPKCNLKHHHINFHRVSILLHQLFKSAVH